MVPVPGGWRRWRAHNLSRCVCSRCLSAVHTFICRSIQRHLRFRERAVPWMALQSPAVSGTVSFLQSWKVPPSSLHRQLYEAHTKGLLLIECSYVNVMCTEYARPTRANGPERGGAADFKPRISAGKQIVYTDFFPNHDSTARSVSLPVLGRTDRHAHDPGAPHTLRRIIDACSSR